MGILLVGRGAYHRTVFFNLAGLYTVFVDILHILVNLEDLEKAVPVGVVRRINSRALACPTTRMMPQVVHQFLEAVLPWIRSQQVFVGQLFLHFHGAGPVGVVQAYGIVQGIAL